MDILAYLRKCWFSALFGRFKKSFKKILIMTFLFMCWWSLGLLRGIDLPRNCMRSREHTAVDREVGRKCHGVGLVTK